MFIMGIDAGNYETKVCTNEGVNCFPSNIGEYRERKLIESFGKDDIIWEYNGQKGFGGTLAKYESEFNGTIKGKTKSHSEGILRILIAIHKYGKDNNQIVVGQPIETHDINEKDKIKHALLGKHTITINSEEKTFSIDKVEIAPEGSAAILANPTKGLVRIIDIGSGTTNFATLRNLKRIDKGSFTEQIGMEIMRSNDDVEMARGIFKILSATWGINDEIYLTGGGADRIYPHLSEYLFNLKIMKPKIDNSIFHTKYSNVVGFYKIAKGLFDNEDHKN